MIKANKIALLTLFALTMLPSAARAQSLEGAVQREPQEFQCRFPLHPTSPNETPPSTTKSTSGYVYHWPVSIPAETIQGQNDYSGGEFIVVQNAPQLQGATMGTIGPQGTDVTIIRGVMTAGTVRVNNLANMEAMLNIVALMALVSGHLIGIFYLVKTIRLTIKTPGLVLGGVAKGLSFIAVGMSSPMFINWAIGWCRDAALF